MVAPPPLSRFWNCHQLLLCLLKQDGSRGMQDATVVETLQSAAKQITVPEDKRKLVQLGNGNGLVCGVGPFCHYAERDGVRTSPLPLPCSKPPL